MERVVVVGAGTMGAGIAVVASRAGLAVEVVEPDARMRQSAAERFAKDGVAVQIRAAIADIDPSAQIAIEAVTERADVKREVFTQLAQRLGEKAILATNTSSLSIEDIAHGIQYPQRVIGLHFFNPAPVMPLVEIIATEQTADEVVSAASALVTQLGKTGVHCADTPGFIVNRVARPFYLQSMLAYEAGVAPIEDLDMLARGVGFRMGPFALMDLIGLDINLATTQSVFERTQADRFAPVATQLELVAQGALGRKSGRGFYSYENGPVKPEPIEPPHVPDRNSDEAVLITGFSRLADEIGEAIAQVYDHIDSLPLDEQIDELDDAATIVFDVSDVMEERSDRLERLDARLPQTCVIFYDAYTTPYRRIERMRFRDRFVGYGILGTLEGQQVIEIVDAQETSDDALALAEEFFAAAGKNVVLVANKPGLYLGRTVGSIINEAVYAVQEDVASADDIDVAMQLGTNYPQGPIAWGRQIGGARLRQLLGIFSAQAGKAYEPSRALWVLDAQESEDDEQP